MDLEPKLKKHIPAILKSYDVIIEEQEVPIIIDRLSYYIYNLIINLCCLISTITIMYGSNKKVVEPKFINISLEYVKDQCYPKIENRTQSGGSYVIDSEYFGTDSGAYKENVSSTKVGNIDFNKLIARPAIEVQMGGGSNDNEQKIYGINLKKIFNVFKVKISTHALQIVKQIIKMHVDCLFIDLKSQKTLTQRHLEKTMKLSRHAVFT
jgi:ribosomal protein L31E